MKIGNTGTTGFFGEYPSGSREWQKRKQSQVPFSLPSVPVSGNSEETSARFILATTHQIQNLMVLPPASYVAGLYSQNQE